MKLLSFIILFSITTAAQATCHVKDCTDAAQTTITDKQTKESIVLGCHVKDCSLISVTFKTANADVQEKIISSEEEMTSIGLMGSKNVSLGHSQFNDLITNLNF